MPHQYELRLHSISDDKEVDWFDDETFEKPWSWVDETELEEQLEVDIKKKDWDIQVVPVVKPRYLNFEEKDLQMEFKTLQMEFKLEQAIKDRNSDDKEVDWFDDETFEKPWSWVDETELEEQLELDIKKVDYTMNPVVELARKEGERVKYWENKGYQTNALHTPYRASKAFNPATYNPSEK